MSNIVIAAEKSQNSKTGVVSATYAPIQSCPKSCPFLDSGCYAQTGNTGIHLSRINRAARLCKKERPIDIARAEAKKIKGLTGKRPLRLHVVGDCKTSRAASIVAKASEEYHGRHGQQVWTYTHAWKEIPREKWGNISVLASCETLKECEHAMERGYAASIVRIKPFDNEFSWKGMRLIPCLELTKGVKCNNCQRCWGDKALMDHKKIICFFPHGPLSNRATDVIRQKWAEQDKGN
jgi:hypothetical protein